MHDGVERRLADIVRRIANIETLSPEQDYFDAGLASVQALELLLEIEAEFGVNLSDDAFANVRNVRELAVLVNAEQESEHHP